MVNALRCSVIRSSPPIHPASSAPAKRKAGFRSRGQLCCGQIGPWQCEFWNHVMVLCRRDWFMSIALLMAVLLAQAPAAERAITTPKEFLGFDLCEDYCLANYKQLASYWARLERESDRLKVVCIGAT